MTTHYDKYMKYKKKYIQIKRDQIDDFPYKKYLMNDDMIMKKFNNLKNYKPNIVYDDKYSIKNLENESDFFKDNIIKYNGRYTLIVNEYSDYENYNILSDYFNEDCRMKCKRYDTELSPYDYWIKKREDVIKYAQKKYHKTDQHSLRESIYELAGECTSFRPTLMVTAIKLFHANSVLDFSAGWGDRLIGAISQNVSYFGVDPNPCLHPNYQKIINMFTTSENRNKYTIIESGFEDVEIPKDKTFDLIFTSPPYFTLEQYVPSDISESEKQSISKFSNLESWLNEFLYVCIDKGYERLEDNGHMVLVINNIRDHPNFIKKMIIRLNEKYKGKLKYLGLIGYTERTKYGYKSPQPMWIWQKTQYSSSSSSNISRTHTKSFNLNPKLIINDIHYKENTYHVIRDDFLIGGSKQRLVYKIMEQSTCDEFVYAGPYYGYAQIALAYCAHELGKKATIIIDKISPRWHLTEKAIRYKPKLIEIENGYLAKLHDYAEKYVKDKKDVCLMPFGLGTPEYINLFAEQIKLALPNDLRINQPKRMWLVAGSGTLLGALYKVFPTTYFNAVQVGKKIWDDQIDKQRTTLYISEEKFSDRAKEQPPYETVATYDAKLWTFVMKYGQDDDYIWNVGRDN